MHQDSEWAYCIEPSLLEARAESADEFGLPVPVMRA